MLMLLVLCYMTSIRECNHSSIKPICMCMCASLINRIYVQQQQSNSNFNISALYILVRYNELLAMGTHIE